MHDLPSFAHRVLLRPWTFVEGSGLDRELQSELVMGHRLYDHRTTLHALAKRFDCDDVLYASDTMVAIVHLTWAKEIDPRWPSCQVVGSLDEWTEMMFSDHEDYDGVPEPDRRALSLELSSPLSLEALRRAFPRLDGTEIEVHPIERSDRVGVYATTEAPLPSWYRATLAHLGRILEEVGATKIESGDRDR